MSVKRHKKLTVIVILLVLIEIFSVIFVWNITSDKETVLDNVKLRDNEKTLKGLAIMIETEHNSDDYEESNTSSWPTTGYKFNKEKSGCIDNSGSTIENSLSYNSTTNIVTVDTGVTTKCYIYFDKRYSLESLCTSGEDTLGECLTNNNSTIESLNDNVEGGLYRYQGTQEIVDDNYICFGTTSKEECTSNTDAYMYRIIGIDENNQLKLIKKEALNTANYWHNNNPDITWPDSDLYKGLNGISGGQYSNLFIGNSSYMPTGWSDKIVDYDWKYGDNTSVNISAFELYEIENGWTSIINAKIGLMYAYDYAYGMSGGNDCSQSGAYSICKTSWLFLENNDLGTLSMHEWTMSRYGYISGRYTVLFVHSTGPFSLNSLDETFAVRPVFYLTTNETYASGNGTIEDPIIIGKTKGLCENGDNLGDCLIENNSAIESLDNTAYSGMYRYTGTDEVVNNNYICFGTSNKTECLNNPEKYMYRMIGVTSENNTTLGLETGQVKLIKDTSIGTHEWDTSHTTDIKWENSSMYSYLQGSDVLGNADIIESGWSSKISSVKWNIGDVRSWTNGDTIYGLESSVQTTNDSKMGLMYMSDYYYAYISGGTRACGTLPCVSWLTDTNHNWSMSRFGYRSEYSNYNGIRIYSDGYIGAWSLENKFAVRPVFYLNANEVFVSGMGTENNPIIIREDASATIIKKDTESDIGLQQEIITGDDLYRFSGTQGNTGINNYVCLGTTSKCESGSDNMYRIIGVNPNNGELKVIKETPWNNSATYVWHETNEDITWLTSDLYNNTVKGIYDELSFKNMIVTNHSWNVGAANSTSIATRESVIDYENNTTGTANIGIMSLTDYYLAYNGDRIWYSDYDKTTNWIGGYLNGNTSNYEWTMTHGGQISSYYRAWSVYGNGHATRSYVTGTRVVRPVFYLKPNVYITNPEATGSSTDPFILAY